jgi:very-short-patch-repair endonuclease
MSRFKVEDLPDKGAFANLGDRVRAEMLAEFEAIRAEVRAEIEAEGAANMAFAARYVAGESMNQLAKEAGCARATLARRLSGMGVAIRGRSEAERLKWDRLKADPAAVERQLAKAWDAARGREVPLEERIRVAKTRYERMIYVNKGETEIADELRRRGLRVEQQLPVLSFNLDVALLDSRITVEVLGSNPKPALAKRLRERAEKLAREGWATVYVETWRREPGLARAKDASHRFVRPRRVKPPFRPGDVAEYVIAFAKELRRDPSTRGQYRVIDGQGQPVSSPGLNPDHRA